MLLLAVGSGSSLSARGSSTLTASLRVPRRKLSRSRLSLDQALSAAVAVIGPAFREALLLFRRSLPRLPLYYDGEAAKSFSSIYSGALSSLCCQPA